MIKIQSWLSIPQPHNAQYKLIFVQWEPCMPSCLQLAVTVVVLGTVKVSHKQLKHQEGVWTPEKNGNSAPQKVTILSTTQWRSIWRAQSSIDTTQSSIDGGRGRHSARQYVGRVLSREVVER